MGFGDIFSKCGIDDDDNFSIIIIIIVLFLLFGSGNNGLGNLFGFGGPGLAPAAVAGAFYETEPYRRRRRHHHHHHHHHHSKCCCEPVVNPVINPIGNNCGIGGFGNDWSLIILIIIIFLLLGDNERDIDEII